MKKREKFKRSRERLGDTYKEVLQGITLDDSNLLDQLQVIAQYYKKQITNEELGALILDLIDRINGERMATVNNQFLVLDPENERDVRWCVELRVNSLHSKILDLQTLPGQELELGFAYLERELLEDSLFGDYPPNFWKGMV